MILFVLITLTTLLGRNLCDEQQQHQQQSHLQVDKIPDFDEQFLLQHYQPKQRNSATGRTIAMQYVPVQIGSKSLIQPQHTTMLLIPLNSHMLHNLFSAQHPSTLSHRYYDYNTLSGSSHGSSFEPVYYHPTVKTAPVETYIPSSNYLDHNNFEQIIVQAQEPQQQSQHHHQQQQQQQQPPQQPQQIQVQHIQHQSAPQQSHSQHLRKLKASHNVRN